MPFGLGEKTELAAPKTDESNAPCALYKTIPPSFSAAVALRTFAHPPSNPPQPKVTYFSAAHRSAERESGAAMESGGLPPPPGGLLDRG